MLSPRSRHESHVTLHCSSSRAQHFHFFQKASGISKGANIFSDGLTNKEDLKKHTCEGLACVCISLWHSPMRQKGKGNEGDAHKAQPAIHTKVHEQFPNNPSCGVHSAAFNNLETLNGESTFPAQLRWFSAGAGTFFLAFWSTTA